MSLLGKTVAFPAKTRTTRGTSTGVVVKEASNCITVRLCSGHTRKLWAWQVLDFDYVEGDC